VGLVIFTQIAIQTVFQAYWLPFGAVRVPHGLELLVDSFVQAGVYAWLLCPPAAAALALGPNRGLDADVAPAH
jgi:hypothetical protein